MDGDGDLDVVTGWEETDNAFAYFNPRINPVILSGAQTCPGQWPMVDITGGFATKSIEDAIFADLDSDGRVDSVVSSNEGTRRDVGVHVLKPGREMHAPGSWIGSDLPGDGNYYMQAAVGRIRGAYGDTSIKTCNDIVVGAKGSEKEFALPGGIIDLDVSTCDPIEIPGQCFHGGIWWWECPKASQGGPFGPDFPDALRLDADGDLDVLFSDRRKVGWFENRTSKAQGENLSGWGDEIALEHMDDLASVNVDAEGHQLKFPSGGPFRFLKRADLDGDGLEDVIVTANFDLRSAIARQAVGRWYRRLDAGGRRWARYWIFPTDPAYVIEGNPNGMGLPYGSDEDGQTVSKSVAVADLNEDGLLDLVFAVRGTGHGVYTLTQQPGSATSGLWNTLHIASHRENYKFDNLQIVDIDGDADLDIVTSEENVGEQSSGLGALYYANPLRHLNQRPIVRCADVQQHADASCSPVLASIKSVSADPDRRPTHPLAGAARSLRGGADASHADGD